MMLRCSGKQKKRVLSLADELNVRFGEVRHLPWSKGGFWGTRMSQHEIDSSTNISALHLERVSR